MLIDQGLLVHDLSPPLVGERPRAWMRRRLDALPAAVQPRLQEARSMCKEVSPSVLEPGGPGGGRRSATLQLTTRGPATLDSKVVARAAALAPLLFGLQQALSPPVAERAMDGELLSRLNALAGWQGAGAYDLAALATGLFGVRPAEDEPPVEPPSPPAALLAWLVEALVASAGARELSLDRQALAAVVPPVDIPSTMELLLSLARPPAGRPPGTGWMLGLHAPAGASLGRFVSVLGREAEAALAQLVAAEAEARPGEEALDVAYAASPALAELSLHPAARRRTLALLGWAEASALTPAELRLVIDPSAAEPLGLQTTGGEAVAPSPLHRVRSTTAPPGLYRLLAGWSFARQHRPWAFGWGPLAGASFLPRVVLEGFVLAPASWRLPDEATCRRPAALARWRRAHKVPRLVQVGEGDELLLVDLAARGAGDSLARALPGRAHEVWPPLDRLVDEGGRRLEAVVALVDRPHPAEAAARQAAIVATASAGRVPPPAEQPPPAQWSSFRLYGTEDAQDAVLHEAIGPAIAQARVDGEIDGWFFLRYVEPGDPRPHLRLRVRTPQGSAFVRRLQQLLEPQRSAGTVVAVESAPYFPETARYGGPAVLPVVERLFEASSDLTLALLAAESEGVLAPELDRRAQAVRAADALARGLRLDPGERRDLAERRRAAFIRQQAEDPAWQQQFRAIGRALQAALAGQTPDGFTAALVGFEKAIHQAVRALPRSAAVSWPALLPALLHMQAVRLLGTRAEDEQASYVFWARALEALAARGLGTGTPPE